MPNRFVNCTHDFQEMFLFPPTQLLAMQNVAYKKKRFNFLVHREKGLKKEVSADLSALNERLKLLLMAHVPGSVVSC